VQQADQSARLVRLSVVLGRELAEHVRLQSFLTRQSQSAYVRRLIEDDAARLNKRQISTKGEMG
jgi:hypothetical protein